MKCSTAVSQKSLESDLLDDVFVEWQANDIELIWQHGQIVKNYYESDVSHAWKLFEHSDLSNVLTEQKTDDIRLKWQHS